jgi:ABC-type antimicrobial peptide transport system permease subunit
VGILVAMGTRFSYIASLYLVKMIALALAASSIGFVAGSELAVGLTSSFLVVQTSSVRILWSHFPAVAGLACLVALCAMTLPMIQLFRMDPNETLIEE